jgi:parallel beta-helix repeat protein
MKKVCSVTATLFILTILFAFMPDACASGPTYVEGFIASDTTWNLADSPYIITNNVTVVSGTNLTIDPGVVIKLNFFTRLIVNGTLLAVGEESQPITFTSNQTNPALGDWSSLKFLNAGNSSGIISNARIEYAIYGIWCVNSSPILTNNRIVNIMSKGIYLQDSHSLVANNTLSNISNTGIDIYQSSPTLESNLVMNTTYYGIKSFKSSPTIMSNTVLSTVKGIYVEESTAVITGNTIGSTSQGLSLERVYGTEVRDNRMEEGNYGIRLVFSNSTVIHNNTIVENDFGIYTLYSSTSILNSTILQSQHKDFHVADESNLVTLNTTFDGSKIMISVDSNLTIRNYLAVKVEDKNGSAILNASVEIEDNFSTLHELSTDNDGWCNWIIVTDRIYDGSEVATENVTTARVFYEGLLFPNNPRDVDMSASHTELFRENSKPTVGITYPANGQVVNSTITISGNSSDDDDNLVTVEILIDEDDWKTVTALGSDWSLWSHQWETRGYPNGDYIIVVRAIDDCLENATYSIVVHVENAGTDSDASQEPDIDLIHLWILFPIIAVIAILALIWHMKRRKGDDREVGDEPKEEVEISLDERIQRLREGYEKGVIPKEVYEQNLAKLGVGVSESTSTEERKEELSYVCPVCDAEVKADATECPNCRSLFEA